MPLIGRITNLDRRKMKLGLYLIVAVSSMGMSRCEPPTQCDPIVANVLIGTSVSLDTPCAFKGWEAYDDFEVFNMPHGFNLSKVTSPVPQRTLSVDSTVAPQKRQPYLFSYTRENGTYSEGTLYVTTYFPLSVLATATPSEISGFGSSQLNAIPTGGVPPYSYSWTSNPALPSGFSGTREEQNPTVLPTQDTIYTVTVTDSIGLKASATATVKLVLSMRVTYTIIPPALSNQFQLHAEVRGGIPPYTLSWTPSASLNDASSFEPFATPSVTTTYKATATDSLGAQVTGTITIVVSTLSITATANPNQVRPGERTQLTAIVTGGMPPYRYSWSPDMPNASTLSDGSIQSPLAFPRESGFYSVSVTDAVGDMRTAFVDVIVSMSIQQLTANPSTINQGQNSQLNAVVIGGNPSSYRYVWTPSAGLSSPGIPNPIATPALTTTYQVTVTSADGQSVTGGVTVNVVGSSAADLSITLTASPEPLQLFQALALTIAVANGGPSDATNVVATYTASIPLSEVAVERITPSQGSCSPPVGARITCQLGTLGRGVTATITMTAFPSVRGTFTSFATVTATEFDPNLTNNTAVVPTTVQ